MRTRAVAVGGKEPAGGFEPAHAGHLQVHQHPVGALCAVRGHRLVAIRALVHFVDQTRQHGPDQLAKLWIVVNDQNGHSGLLVRASACVPRMVHGNRRR